MQVCVCLCRAQVAYTHYMSIEAAKRDLGYVPILSHQDAMMRMARKCVPRQGRGLCFPQQGRGLCVPQQGRGLCVPQQGRGLGLCVCCAQCHGSMTRDGVRVFIVVALMCACAVVQVGQQHPAKGSPGPCSPVLGGFGGPTSLAPAVPLDSLSTAVIAIIAVIAVIVG
jgi:hypothetical protein